MIIVADSGSTKTDWMLIHADGALMISTMGFNPLYHSEDLIYEESKKELDKHQVEYGEVTAMFYYGTAVWDHEKADKIHRAMHRLFPNAEVEVEHDLLGAARATCGHDAGIACIIGTGSNTCLFDGKDVTDNVVNLGFFVGDEGSGAHLGKELVRAYFYRELPIELFEAFEKFVPGGQAEILENVYSKPSPNVYLASFTRFLGEFQSNFFIQKLIYKSFAEFIDRNARKYPNHMELPIHFIGSVAYYFQDILKVILEERGMKPGVFILKPIDSLVQFHKSSH
jgi:N-acetylglucosamine kinase-like BadF-type ATPase